MNGRAASTALALVLLTACGGLPSRRVDVAPPRLVEVTPSGSVVDPSATLRLRFSEPLKRSSVFQHTVADDPSSPEVPDAVLLVTAADRDKVVRTSSGKTSRAVDNLPLSESERAVAVPAEVALSTDRMEITVAPSDGFVPDTTYHLFLSREVSDDANNRLVDGDTRTNVSIELRFVASPAVDRIAPVAQLRSPVAGQAGVPVDLDAVEIVFSEAVDTSTLDAAAVGLVEESTGLRMLPVELLWRGETLIASFAAPDASGWDDGSGACGVLCLGDSYRLFADGAVRDLAGNLSTTGEAERFTAAICRDVGDPRFGPDVDVVAGDTSVELTWRTDEASTSEVVFSLCGDGDCPEPFIGERASCDVDVCDLPESSDAFACVHRVELRDLLPSTTYTVTLVSRDAGGRGTSGHTLSFTTLPPQPRLAITELLAAPQGLADPNQGKFVELQNVGRVAVDLSSPAGGWKLARCGDPSCATLTNSWPMRPAAGASGLLAPGAVAVAAGTAFDAAAMGVPSGTLMLRHTGSASTVLSNGLTATTVYTYVLVAPDGSIASRYGAYLGKPDSHRGRAFERVAPEAPDAAETWRLSDAPVPGAPGNYATPGSSVAAAD